MTGVEAEALTRFEVMGEEEPHLALRLLNHFAMRVLVPHRIEAWRQDGMLRVTIVQAGMPEPIAEIVAEKMRQLISVAEVRLRSEPAGQ